MKTKLNDKNSTDNAESLKQKAEKLLKEKLLITDLHPNKNETQKLIHELAVHQIELELQNEELKLANERAEIASLKYIELYDSAPIGYFTLSPKGEILELNLCGANMLGKEPSRLIHSLFGFFVSDDTKPDFNLFLGKVFTGKAKEACEVALSTNGESLSYVHLAGIVTENINQCFITVTDVTEHKRAEEKRLHNSEERFRLLYENAKIGLYRTTPDGTIVLANKALVSMLGYQSFDELARRNIDKDGFVTPQQRHAFLKKIEQTGEVENFESIWIRQDRTHVFIRESARVIRDSDGNTIYYDGTAEDITQLKHTQDDLDWNMALLAAKANSTTPNSSVDAILVVDQQGKKIFQNPRAADLLKVPRHIADEKDDESELQWLAGLNKDPKSFIEKVKYLYSHPNEVSKDVLEYKDGTFLDRYTAPVIGKGGKYYGRLWIFRDITMHRRTEEALRESEARYRMLFEVSADGILIVEVETRMFKYANPAMCQMLGYTAEELTTLGMSDIHPSKDLKWVIEEFEAFARGDKTLICGIPCITKDGSIVYTDINTNTITIDGRTCAVGIFRDISEHKRAEEALKSALERSHRQQAVVTSVAVSPQLVAGDVSGLAHQLNEHAAKTIDVERVSVWLFNNGGDELECVDLYESSPDQHSAGAVLKQDEYMNEFEALRTAKYIDANDPLTDPRTTGYVEGYIKPLHITSMLDSVIRDGNRNIGVLCFEHVGKKHNWEPDEIAFTSQLADQIALTVLNHERLLSEDLLRQNEIKLQVIIESTADGILAIDSNGKVIRTNNRFAELWKIPLAILNSGEDAILLDYVLEQLISPKQFLDKVQQLYNSTDEDSDTLFFKDGRIFERYSAPLLLDDKIIGRVWSFRDITERKRAEEALLESKNIIQNIIDNSPSLIYILDLDGRFILANRKLAEVLNFPAEKLLGNTRQLFMPTEFADQHRTNDLQIITTEQAAIYEEEILESDGKHIYLTQKFPLFNSEGKIYAVGGISTDITERKRAEQALIESETRARALIDAIPDLIFKLNSQGVFLEYRAAKEDLAYQNGSIIGKECRDILSPEFSGLIEEKIKLALQTGQMQVFEYQLLLPLKGMGEFEARMVCNTPDEVIVIVRDVTERKKADEEIKRINEKLLKLNAEKDKFFSIIAHDLKGPFSGFLGLTEIMANNLPNLTMDEIQKISVNMRISATNLFRLLENLLEWARMQQGLIPFNPEIIRLLPVVDECINIVLGSAKNKGIEFNCDIPEDLHIIADSNMLQTILRNLASNAVKFTPKGGEIEVSAKINIDKSIEISVKDTGIGMSGTMVDILFGLNDKTNRKGTEGEPSTGLGLLLCKDFVEKHGGKIWVESEELKGSTFYFTIP